MNCPTCGQEICEGVTLVRVRGRKQKLADPCHIGGRKASHYWLRAVPVINIREERTIPPKEPITEPKAG